MVDDRYDLVYERALYAISQGDRDLAISLLKQVVQLNPNSAGAWLDLGLVYCDAGLSHLAEEVFQVMERRFQLPALIQQTVNDRRLAGCGDDRINYRVTYQIAVGAASNANIAPSSPLVQIGSGPAAVILELSDKFRPKADNFIDLGLQVQGPERDDKNKFLFLVSTRQHTQLRDYDFTNILGAYSRTTSFNREGEPSVVLTSMASQSTLAGQRFDQTGRLGIDGWIRIGEMKPSRDRLPSRIGIGLLATVSRYDRDPEYNSLRFDALLRQEGSLGGWSVQSNFGPLVDRPTEGRPGGERKGWSGAAEFQKNGPSGRLIAGFSGQFTKDERPYSAVFFPGVIRDTRRIIATARFERNARDLEPSFPDVTLFFQGTSDHLSDSISIFSYKNQVLTAGFLKYF